MDRSSILRCVDRALDQMGLKHAYGVISPNTFNSITQIESKLEDVAIFVTVYETSVNIYIQFFIPSSFEIENIPNNNKIIDEMVKYTTLANYGLKDGCFEYDINDNDLRYKTFIECHDLPTSSEGTFIKSLKNALGVSKVYADGIFDVVHGLETAEDAFKKAVTSGHRKYRRNRR